MKRFACPLAILAVAAALAAPAAAQQFEIQNSMSAFNQAESLARTKQIDVRSATQVKPAFGLAAKERGRQAIEISCSPAGSDWCAKDFVDACANAKGGMSTNPEGGVTCSLPQYQ